MKSYFNNLLPVLPTTVLIAIVIQVFFSWVFVRFVLYESQYRLLPKDIYQIEIITLDDYAKLQDRSLEEVKLSNGTMVANRQPAYYQAVLPNYKKVDDHYVLVTTLGTSFYYDRWLMDCVPLGIMALFGLFCQVLLSRRRAKKTTDDSVQG